MEASSSCAPVEDSSSSISCRSIWRASFPRVATFGRNHADETIHTSITQFCGSPWMPERATPTLRVSPKARSNRHVAYRRVSYGAHSTIVSDDRSAGTVPSVGELAVRLEVQKN